MVWQTLSLSAASWLDLGCSSFNIGWVVLGFKLPPFTGYCSIFTVVRVLLSLALSSIIYQVSL